MSETNQICPIALKAYRDHRDAALSKTDFMLLPDSPFTEAQKEQARQYRQFLRDAPQKATEEDIMTFKGFPTFDQFIAAP